MAPGDEKFTLGVGNYFTLNARNVPQATTKRKQKDSDAEAYLPPKKVKPKGATKQPAQRPVTLTKLFEKQRRAAEETFKTPTKTLARPHQTKKSGLATPPDSDQPPKKRIRMALRDTDIDNLFQTPRRGPPPTVALPTPQTTVRLPKKVVPTRSNVLDSPSFNHKVTIPSSQPEEQGVGHADDDMAAIIPSSPVEEIAVNEARVPLARVGTEIIPSSQTQEQPLHPDFFQHVDERNIIIQSSQSQFLERNSESMFCAPSRSLSFQDTEIIPSSQTQQDYDLTVYGLRLPTQANIASPSSLEVGTREMQSLFENYPSTHSLPANNAQNVSVTETDPSQTQPDPETEPWPRPSNPFNWMRSELDSLTQSDPEMERQLPRLSNPHQCTHLEPESLTQSDPETEPWPRPSNPHNWAPSEDESQTQSDPETEPWPRPSNPHNWRNGTQPCHDEATDSLYGSLRDRESGTVDCEGDEEPGSSLSSPSSSLQESIPESVQAFFREDDENFSVL